MSERFRHVRTNQEEMGLGPPRYAREPLPIVALPEDWRREGMVVVIDSWTGELLGCMGSDAWQELTEHPPLSAEREFGYPAFDPDTDEIEARRKSQRANSESGSVPRLYNLAWWRRWWK